MKQLLIHCYDNWRLFGNTGAESRGPRVCRVLKGAVAWAFGVPADAACFTEAFHNQNLLFLYILYNQNIIRPCSCILILFDSYLRPLVMQLSWSRCETIRASFNYRSVMIAVRFTSSRRWLSEWILLSRHITLRFPPRVSLTPERWWGNASDWPAEQQCTFCSGWGWAEQLFSLVETLEGFVDFIHLTASSYGVTLRWMWEDSPV